MHFGLCRVKLNRGKLVSASVPHPVIECNLIRSNPGQEPGELPEDNLRARDFVLRP